MTHRSLPSRAYLMECLSYNSETGVLIWKQRPLSHFKNRQSNGAWNTKYAGKTAGTAIEHGGYHRVLIDGMSYVVHRVIWKIMNDHDPLNQIDHIDHDKGNNSLSNLRDATVLMNMQNRSIDSRNKSGQCGVYWHKKANKWCAEIKTGKKKTYLGLFASIESAIEARKNAEASLGFHLNHGSKTT